MKKSILVIGIALTMSLFSCGGNDITKVKEGMSKEEVIELAGEPNSSMSMFGGTMMKYENYMITIKDDKVVKIISKDDAMKAVETMDDDIEEAEKLIEDAQAMADSALNML